MTFDQLLDQIELLRGIWLQPLGKARRLKVEGVDRKAERVMITVEGEARVRSRSFAEFSKLLEALTSRPAVHVDSELAGSGSSRNQPETILANLPGIEHLRIAGKKHLAVVADRPRPYGTLREMDSVVAIGVAEALQDAEAAPFVSILIVDEAFITFGKALAERLGLTSRALTSELLQIGGTATGLFVGSPNLGLRPGTYPIFRSIHAVNSKSDSILLNDKSVSMENVLGRFIGFVG